MKWCKRLVAIVAAITVTVVSIYYPVYAGDGEEHLFILTSDFVSEARRDEGCWTISAYSGEMRGSGEDTVALVARVYDYDSDSNDDITFRVIWSSGGRSFNYINTETYAFANKGLNVNRSTDTFYRNYETPLKFSYHWLVEKRDVKLQYADGDVSTIKNGAVSEYNCHMATWDHLRYLFENINLDEIGNEEFIKLMEATGVYLNTLGSIMYSYGAHDDYDSGKKVQLTEYLYLGKNGDIPTLYIRQSKMSNSEYHEIPNLYESIIRLSTLTLPNDKQYIYDYSQLDELAECLENIVKGNDELINNQSQFSGNATLDEWMSKPNKTAEDYWWIAALNYVLTGGNCLNMGWYSRYDITKINSLSDTEEEAYRLTDEQRLRIQTYINVALQCTDFSDRSQDAKVLDLDTSKGYDFKTTPNMESVRETAERVIANDYPVLTETSSVQLPDKTASNMVDNAYGLVVYLAAKMYGYSTEDATIDIESAGTDAEYIDRCLYLEALEPDIDNVVRGGIVSVSTRIPEMGNMQHIAAAQKAYDAYAKLVYLYMLMEQKAEFSFGMAYDSAGDANYASESSSNKYNNIGLESWLADAQYSAEEDLDFSDVAATFTAYSNMYKAMTYLGITPYEDTALFRVKEYYGYISGYLAMDSYIQESTLVTNNEALGAICSVSSREFTEDYKTGVALSSTYIPLQTNVYDVHSIDMLEDSSWVSRFHYGYGFYRKALYIDKNINAAVDRYVTGSSSGEFKVATLRDLLSCEQDIVLYLDDGFYNVNKLADLQGYSYNKVNNAKTSVETTDQNADIWDTLTDWYQEFNDLDIESIVKTGDKSVYSSSVRKKVMGTYNNTQKKENGKYVLTSSLIDEYLNVNSMSTEDYHDEYSVLQSFAVVSAIYRQSLLYNVVSKQVKKVTPVFVSSANLAAVENAKQEQWNTLYNYIMLKNLESALGIDYASTLDLDSVLYMDIYGNILTEGGLVVIPAASNATINKPSEYTLYTAGFLSLYSYGNYEIPLDYSNADKYAIASNSFVADEENGVYKLQDAVIKVDEEPTQLRAKNIELNDSTVKYALQSWMNYKLKDKGYVNFAQRVYVVTEVLRGAPIDAIDKEFEGLGSPKLTSTFGIYMANKLDEIVSQLLPTSNGNSFITLPNLAYMPNVEYVVFYLFKIVFAGLLLLLVIRIYKDATQGRLGLKSAVQFIIANVMFLVAAFSIPSVLDISYYQVNKLLLQDETTYIMMLNLEKESEGKEIGLTSVDNPESATELYLKVDDLDIPWYTLLSKVLTDNSYNSVSEVYDDALRSNVYHGLSGVEQKGNGLYVSLDYIFNSSIIEFDSETGKLVTKVKSTPYVSFLIPYYVELDYLVSQINNYNNYNNIDSPELSVGSGGSVKTLGLITPYLTSQEFMELSVDPTGLKFVYKRPTLLAVENPFSNSDLSAMEGSLWYADNLESDELDESLAEVSEYARDFVVKYKSALGKVSDDVFLKTMAMSIAVKHNSVMNTSSASAIELYSIDAKDLIRLSLTNRENVLKGASFSFARYVYTYGGGLGVLMSVILVVIYFVSSLLKPLCIFGIIAVILLSLVIRKFRRGEDNYALEGFIISLGLLCTINVVYALMLKCSMLLANTGMSMVMNLVIQIVIQILYMLLLVYFTGVVVTNWKDFGRTKYERAFRSLASTFNKANISGKDVIVDASQVSFSDRGAKGYGRRHRSGRDTHEESRDIWERIMENDARRLGNRGKK